LFVLKGVGGVLRSTTFCLATAEGGEITKISMQITARMRALGGDGNDDPDAKIYVFKLLHPAFRAG